MRTLVFVFDGLRPDYIRPEIMPNLYSLKEKGAYGADHHCVFPTLTRVNAASFATGSYPSDHGIMGNLVYMPEVDKTKGVNLGDIANIKRITETTQDSLVTSISLGEVLTQAGTYMMVFSAATPGSAFLQNHTLGQGGIINPGIIQPSDLEKEVIATIGAPPPERDKSPNKEQHVWITNAFLKYGLVQDGPLVSTVWFKYPDGSAHRNGVGAPLTIESLEIVDQQFGLIMKALKDKNLEDSFNIIITADHGFITNVGKKGLRSFMIEQGLMKEIASDDVVLAEHAIYVKDQDPAMIKKIVLALQQEEWVGAIFTKASPGQEIKGWVDGTLSLKSIHMDHDTRTPDILVDYNWDNSKNSYGYEGRSYSGGVAGHGGSSPYEIHIPLIAFGPSFRNEFVSPIPSSNVDIVPTILHLSGLPIPPDMDGRVMSELLSGNAVVQDQLVTKEILETSVTNSWGTYNLILERSVVGTSHYVNYAKARREYVEPPGKVVD